MLASEVAVLKSRHGISVKCSRYRDTGPTDPSLVYINNHKMLSGNIFGLILRNKMAATGVFCQS